MRGLWTTAFVLLGGMANAAGLEVEDQGPVDPVYPTFGVHNPPEYTQGCAQPDCLVRRGPGAPSDPLFPLQWVSDWTMYRVFRNYEDHPPPYASPPEGLVEDEDYTVSSGTTSYDSTYSDDNGSGAMMEFYQDYCLPIFPIDAHYTCAFISLGNIAYFLTFEKDRPKDMPACCRFSNLNPPPRRDFVKHLPWDEARSAQLPDTQAYALTTPGPDGAPILFGYAFQSVWREDPDAPGEGAYRHPSSFFFSGTPTDPPNAPIVSQNYTNFSARKPDPSKTWDLVGQQCTGEIPWCKLFDP